MELKDLSSINFASYNPRTLSQHDGQALNQSIRKFGDISGITNNLQTNTLVTGHQRLKILKQHFGDSVKIQITERYDGADQFGTVANGYVFVPDTNLRLSYREVIWPVEIEKAANIAANRIQGEFDQQLLAELDYELAQLDDGAELLALTGQTEDELKSIMKQSGPELDDKPPEDETEANSLTFSLTREQREIVEEAINHIKATREMAAEKNSSLNGNALYYLCRDHLDRLHGLIDENAPIE